MGEVPFVTNINWKINGDKRLADAIKYSSDVCSSEDDLDETVSLESCIHLQTNAVSKCTLTLKASRTDITIRQLTIVSEAKKLEIYSSNGEYITTANCEFVLKLDEFTVNKAVINFAQPLTSCSIKFLSLPCPGKFWLYGVRITGQSTDSSNNASNLDMNRVLERIQQSDQNISEKAKGFARFLSEYQAKPSAPAGDMMNLLKTFASSNHKWLGPQGDIPDNIDQTLFNNPSGKNILQENINGETSNFNALTHDGATVTEARIVARLSDVIKDVIHESESRLWKKIDNRLEVIEARQLEILDRLRHLTDVCTSPDNIISPNASPDPPHD